MTDARSPRYRAAAIVLHWAIAALILVQVALGLRMGEARSPETFAVFQLHKSVGVTILLLSLARLGLRLAFPPPPLPAAMAGWEKAAARATHAGFYAIMIGMPLTGWLMVSTSPLRIPTLLYGAIPWPDLPGFAAISDAVREHWRLAGLFGHQALAVGFVLLFLLHVAGALKHQRSGDAPVLARMVPGMRPGRLAEPRLLAVAFGLVAAVALGVLIRPRPQQAPQPSVAAASVRPASVAGAPAQTGEAPAVWSIEPASHLDFATAWGGQPITGRFHRWRSEIVFSPHALARSRVRVEVDLASVDSGDKQRDAVLPGADWLGAPAQPTAVFTADRFEALGGDRFVAHGALNLRGVTRPVDLTFTLARTGDRARAAGAARLDRTAFGVGQGEWARTDQIPAAVTVSIDLAARTKNPAGPVGGAGPESSLGRARPERSHR